MGKKKKMHFSQWSKMRLSKWYIIAHCRIRETLMPNRERGREIVASGRWGRDLMPDLVSEGRRDIAKQGVGENSSA